MTIWTGFLCSVWLFIVCFAHGTATAQDAPFRRGDSNTDGKLDVSDGLATLGFLFLGDEVLLCEDAADADDNGRLQIGDASFTFNFLFLDGVGPPAPGPEACGDDPSDDALACDRYTPERGRGCFLHRPRGELFETLYFLRDGDERVHAIEDFNGDGVLDMAFGSEGPRTIALHLGVGDGRFAPVPETVAPILDSRRRVIALEAADLDGDGILDLAAISGRANASPADPTSLFLLLGRGDGTFRPGSELPAIAEPFAVDSGDLDGDGDLDLVVAANTPAPETPPADRAARLYVLRNTGGGEFTLEGPQDAAPNLLRQTVSNFFLRDLDADGDLDAVLAIVNQDQVTVLTNTGNGEFDARHVEGVTWPLALGDVDGDANLDIVGALPEFLSLGRGLAVVIGLGGGTFAPAAPLAGWESFALGDVNGDGDLDVVQENPAGFGVYFGLGDTTFGLAGAGFGVSPCWLRDFDGDGVVDLAGRNYSPIGVLKGGGDGTFHDPLTDPLDGNPAVALAGDFDLDGNLDLAVAHHASAPYAGEVSILVWGSGTAPSWKTGAWSASPSVVRSPARTSTRMARLT